MDFTRLIQLAKQNRENGKDESKFYRAKLAPAKKETKESKQLSENIQKFLKKRELEDKQRELEEKKKLANLLAMRDEKSRNKIRKMLKVTKSANKSVLDDACSETNTAVTMDGPDQPDQDDYGYVSYESNMFYEKYIDKVKDVKDDKGFAPSRPQSVKDLSGTKERVKAAIIREKDGKINGIRNLKPIETLFGSRSKSVGHFSVKPQPTLYDAEAERREEEERKLAERKKKANSSRKPVPPPMDFSSLLKLAEKKQHEPIRIVQEVKKEPERLLTLKEKREQEEQKRAREARQRSELEKLKNGRSFSTPTFANATKCITPSATKKSPIPVKQDITNKSDDNRRRSDANSSSSKKLQSSLLPTSSLLGSKQNNVTVKSNAAATTSKSNEIKFLSSGRSKSLSMNTNKSSPNESSKPSSSRDNKVVSTKAIPGSKRHLSVPNMQSKYKAAARRRIYDDDDDEYDSEMDDFIDDGEAAQDLSSVLKDVFGYDKSKYNNRDCDYDDRNMESNFAQVQREEYISKKIGMQEDLEDMRLEALQKERKRKIMKRNFN